MTGGCTDYEDDPWFPGHCFACHDEQADQLVVLRDGRKVWLCCLVLAAMEQLGLLQEWG